MGIGWLFLGLWLGKRQGKLAAGEAPKSTIAAEPVVAAS
jgi:hypothetical protein